jgi:hypothetical protein
MSLLLRNCLKRFVVVFWSDETVKNERLCLESEYKPYLQSLVEDAGRIKMRLDVEVLHPDERKTLERRLVYSNYCIIWVSS